MSESCDCIDRNDVHTLLCLELRKKELVLSDGVAVHRSLQLCLPLLLIKAWSNELSGD